MPDLTVGPASVSSTTVGTQSAPVTDPKSVSPPITVAPLNTTGSTNAGTQSPWPDPKTQPSTATVTVPPLHLNGSGTGSGTSGTGAFATDKAPDAAIAPKAATVRDTGTQPAVSVVGPASFNTNDSGNIRLTPQSGYSTTGSTQTGGTGVTASPTVVRETGLASSTPTTSLRNSVPDPAGRSVSTPPLLASTVESSPLRPDAATVDMYDESEINTGTADSYAGLSQRFYGTAEYADALRLWNRDHRKSTAIVGADNKLRGEQGLHSVDYHARETLSRCVAEPQTGVAARSRGCQRDGHCDRRVRHDCDVQPEPIGHHTSGGAGACGGGAAVLQAHAA